VSQGHSPDVRGERHLQPGKTLTFLAPRTENEVVTAESTRGSRTKDWISSVVWFALLDTALRLAGVYATETAVAAFLGAAIGTAWVFAIGGQALRRGLPATQLAPWLPPTSGAPEMPDQPVEEVPDAVITPDIVRRAKIFKWSLRVWAIPFLPMIGTRRLLDKIA
jgi:hypothetical protein